MRFAPTSIAARLTLLVGAIALAVFIVIGTVLYMTLDGELARRDADKLTEMMTFVQHLLSEVDEVSTAESLAHHLDDMVVSHGNLRVWITRRDGHAPIYGGAPPPVPAQHGGSAYLFTHDDGTPMRALAMQVRPSTELSSLDVLIASDTRPTQRILADFRLVLVSACLAGVIAMVLLGVWAARRGLRPVGRLSAEAQAIGPQALSQRLPVAVLPAELVDLAQSFNRVLDRLEQSYRQLEAFNADVAHELRTPLSNLIGGTEVTLLRERSVAELRDLLGSNLEDLQHIKTIVNDMLFLARADRGERADAAPVALAQVARGVAEFFEPVLDERRITLEIRGEAHITGDIGLLRRAVSNLVSNAIEHTTSGNTIEIVISNADATAHLRVCNPGPPIAPEHLAHIFDRFYRVDPARSASGESHGLGLAIVKAVAQMHGGGVFARCEDGVTEIGLHLPCT